MKKLFFLLLLPLLTQCSSNSANSSGSGLAAPLPILSSPARAKAWGAPEVQQLASGYRTTYTNPANPKEKVSIIGSSKLMPFVLYPPHIQASATQASQPQLWNKAVVQRKTLKWYQLSFPSSEKGAKFSTLGIELENQSGGRGQYKIEIEGTKNQVPSWLAELRFAH